MEGTPALGVAAGGRFDLRVWLSEDEGTSWSNETVLVEGFVQYSVADVLDDGSVGILYEATDPDSDRLAIHFIRFDVEEIEE